jgi:hypothetical protein
VGAKRASEQQHHHVRCVNGGGVVQRGSERRTILDLLERLRRDGLLALQLAADVWRQTLEVWRRGRAQGPRLMSRMQL